MDIQDGLARIAGVGIGATAVMDVGGLVLRWAGIPSLNFALMGRWMGHWARGTWRHAAISKADPVRGEVALGWLLHYATGIVFAALLVALTGTAWLAQPSLLPALVFGIVTVAAPWFVMQPAMGAGIASSRTPMPTANRVRSLANHAIFGVGLYAAAFFINWI